MDYILADVWLTLGLLCAAVVLIAMLIFLVQDYLEHKGE